MRRLIINADDFGLTAGVNRAILQAHKQGVVTSATLMANGQAFSEAVRACEPELKLSVGCHTVLVDGTPILDIGQIPSLGHSQRFRRGFGDLAVAALRGRLDPSHIEAEVTAQIRKLQSSGINVSHVDTHKHSHVLPQVLRPVLRAAKACGVRAIRNPFEPVRLKYIAAYAGHWQRFTQIAVLRNLAGKFRQAVTAAGMITPDGTFGIIATGALGERFFRYIIENLSEGTWEMVCHPGYDDADLRKVHTRLLESRTRELELLTSPASRELLVKNGIDLISYRDLL
ncbi:MAG TPA: ChbG/HpnK family deacetylase [Terriglobales bacterium]